MVTTSTPRDLSVLRTRVPARKLNSLRDRLPTRCECRLRSPSQCPSSGTNLQRREVQTLLTVGGPCLRKRTSPPKLSRMTESLGALRVVNGRTSGADASAAGISVSGWARLRSGVRGQAHRIRHWRGRVGRVGRDDSSRSVRHRRLQHPLPRPVPRRRRAHTLPHRTRPRSCAASVNTQARQHPQQITGQLKRDRAGQRVRDQDRDRIKCR